MRLRRPIDPAHATLHEAIAYLASACDGAICRDGHGFSADHVRIGHQLARQHRWGRRQRRTALQLARIYRRQLEQAGFYTEILLSGHAPQRISRRRAQRLSAGWLTDPTGIHQHRYWNGARWTSATTDPRSSNPSPHGFMNVGRGIPA